MFIFMWIGWFGWINIYWLFDILEEEFLFSMVDEAMGILLEFFFGVGEWFIKKSKLIGRP